MAGSAILSTTPTVTERQRQPLQSTNLFTRTFSSPLAIHTVNIPGGARLTTLMSEDADFDSVLRQMQREGKLVLVEAETKWGKQLVALYVNGTFIVCSDKNLVGRGDFSAFNNPKLFRSIALDATAYAGADMFFHAFIDQDGIPVALRSNGDVDHFLNFNEMHAREYTIALVNAKDDARNLTEFRYEGGTGAILNQETWQKLSAAHAEDWNGEFKLTKTAVFSIRTGELTIIDNSHIAVDGFASPEFQVPSFQLQPQFASLGFPIPTERGSIVIPMDGSPNRIPYICVKSFDGKLTEHIQMQTAPLMASTRQLLRLPTQETETRSNAITLYFSTLCKDASVLEGHSPDSPFSSAAVQDVQAYKSFDASMQQRSAQSFHSMKISSKLISYYWHHPSLLQNEDIQHVSTKPPLLASSVPKKVRNKKPQQSAEKSERIQEKKKAKPKLNSEAPRRRKRKPHQPTPSVYKFLKKQVKKPNEVKIPRLFDISSARKKEKRAKQLRPVPEVPLRKKEAKRRLIIKPPKQPPESVRKKKERRVGSGAGAIRKASAAQKPKVRMALRVRTERKAFVASSRKAQAERKSARGKTAEAKKKRAKKRLSTYFRMELLGLLPKRKRRFSYGRAAARSSV
jgi:hypothetical protein